MHHTGKCPNNNSHLDNAVKVELVQLCAEGRLCRATQAVSSTMLSFVEDARQTRTMPRKSFECVKLLLRTQLSWTASCAVLQCKACVWKRTDLHADLFETKQLVPAGQLSRVVKLRAGSKMNVNSSI